MAKSNAQESYIDQPCDRCGSKKRISKTWNEKLQMSLGVSIIEVSQIVCTNKVCQVLFDKNRKEEVARLNERKLKKEEQDKIRKENIARTIAKKRESKKNHAKNS